MYQSFFQFSQLPFQITPNPYFFFLSKHHEEALSHLTFGIQERRGFILITGEIGTGKTTLCRLILDRLGPAVKTSLIFNPNLSTLELLQSINQDFGLSGSSSSKKELVDELNRFLLRELEAGGNAVLIIDEAQNLPIQCLEEVRMLSNLETQNDKLIQIVLMGQPELRDKLELPELRQLNQRIALRHHLLPLSESEVKRYIQFRLKMARGEERAFFTPEGIRNIYDYTHGVPRLVNILCDKSLLAAFVAESHVISKQVVNKAIRELDAYREDRMSNFKKNRFKHGFKRFQTKKVFVHAAYSVIALLLIASFIFILGSFVPWKEKKLLGEKAKTKTVASMGMGGEAGALTDPTPAPGSLNGDQQSVLLTANLLQPYPRAGNSKGGDKNPLRPSRLGEFPKLTGEIFNPFFKNSNTDLFMNLTRDEGVFPVREGFEGTQKEVAQTLLSLWDPWFDHKRFEKWNKRDDLNLQTIVKGWGFETFRTPLNWENVLRLNSPFLFEIKDNDEKSKYWVMLQEVNGPTATLLDPITGERYIPKQQLEALWGTEGIILWKPLSGLTFPLTFGSMGTGVVRLQRLLRENGFFEGEIDGIYGSLTFDGVIRLQKHLGMKENGLFDAETAFFLTRLILGSQTPSLKKVSPFPIAS